jgi:hypothetical protein
MKIVNENNQIVSQSINQSIKQSIKGGGIGEVDVERVGSAGATDHGVWCGTLG